MEARYGLVVAPGYPAPDGSRACGLGWDGVICMRAAAELTGMWRA